MGVTSERLDQEALLTELRAMILEVMEEEEGEVEVRFESHFQRDLELESIELIALGDLLRARYGQDLDFTGWLTQLSLDDLAALTVGDLTRWLEGALRARDEA
jgi:acyl carrier protein